MPRSVYYQDSGNSLQADRLPVSRPALALPHVALPWSASAVSVAWLLVRLVMLVGCVHFLLTYDGASAVVPTAILFVAVCLYVGIKAYGHLESEDWRRLIILVGGLTLCALASFSPRAQLVIAALAVSYLGWQLGHHWIVICTASPVRHRDALRLRQEWIGSLACRAALPTLLSLLAVIGHADYLAVSLLVACCGVNLLWRRPSGARVGRFRLLAQVVASWCLYNRDVKAAPGLLPSPAGSRIARLLTTCLSVLLVAVPLTRLTPMGIRHADPFPYLWLYVSIFLYALVVPLVAILPTLHVAAIHRRQALMPEDWAGLVDDVQHSPDPIESHSYYIARVVSDGSPLLVPRDVFREHAHFLGDSGAGKTALGLAPWIEQTVLRGDASVVVIDLKADSLELLATLHAAAEQVRLRTRRRIPLQFFSNQSHLATYSFNPLTQQYWSQFDPYIRTDILCGAMGLSYGSDYGAGWYAAANAAVAHHAIKKFPGAQTLRQLAQHVRDALFHAKKQELHDELRSAGVHVQAVLDRLGSFDALNVAPGTGHPEQVVAGTIDLAELFRRPGLLYFHLSSTIAGSSSPEIARLFAYSLLCASTQTQRRCPVFLVIDEFQRMVAHNVEYMLQLARSMGVGVILANQSMQDLRTMGTNLIPPIESNCRFRQWFSVSSLDDRERLVQASGETVEQFVSHTNSRGPNGSSTSTTVSQQVMSRFSRNDIALASDHPLRSIVTVSRGSGYAQYGGLPVIVESNYHITPAEYERRKQFPWPSDVPGTYVPRDHRPPAAPTPPAGPTVITEEIQDFFGGIGFTPGNKPSHKPPPRRSRRDWRDQP